MDDVDVAGLDRLRRVMGSHVDAGSVPGLVWLVARGERVEAGSAGVLDTASAAPVGRDAIFRISSMTKPVTAVAALVLVEECRLRLDDPVDDLLPELADRRVLARPDGPLDDTVPAARPITLRDLLTFRLGLGSDLTGRSRQPVMERAAALGVGAGPPAPAGVPALEEYLRRLGTLPLQHQPGERWLYHTSADVLGVLVARAAGQPLDVVLAERVLGPLGMRDTGFWVPPEDLQRFGPAYWTGPSGSRAVYDPAEGQWSSPPAFPGGGAGLVSTADDVLAFAAMLRGGGALRGTRVLSPGSVAAMTTDHLTAQQSGASGLDPSGAVGWGFAVAVQRRRTDPTRSAGSYGWIGGLGSVWTNDPAADLTAVLLTNQAWTSPVPPPVAQDFLTCAFTAP